MSDPIETIAEVIGGVDYDYEQRDQARRIVIAIRTSLPLRRSLWLALTADNPLSRLTKAPSSPVSETEPEARPTDYLRGYRDGLNAVLDAIERDPLREATSHNDPEFGFDKTAALSDPSEACPDSCGEQSWTGVDTNYGPKWRCDTCNRIVSQAADDRRAL